MHYHALTLAVEKAAHTRLFFQNEGLVFRKTCQLISDVQSLLQISFLFDSRLLKLLC